MNFRPVFLKSCGFPGETPAGGEDDCDGAGLVFGAKDVLPVAGILEEVCARR